jgi:hypothetical protein
MDRRDRSLWVRFRSFLFAIGAAWFVATPCTSAAQALIYGSGYEDCTGSPTAGLVAWSAIIGSPVAGEPDDAPEPVARYAGRCAMRADAAGDYVRDDSPVAEPTFLARFYVYPGFVNGTATVMRARAGATSRYEVRLTANASDVTIELLGRGGVPMTVATVPTNRWYGITLDWHAPSGLLQIHVRGGQFFNIGPLSHPNPPQSGDFIDVVELGWISGSATISPAAPDPRSGVLVDEYESRRTGLPGFLLPGDANGNGSYSQADVTAILNEVGGTLATGSPDCNEDGLVDSADAGCVASKALRFRNGME